MRVEGSTSLRSLASNSPSGSNSSARTRASWFAIDGNGKLVALVPGQPLEDVPVGDALRQAPFQIKARGFQLLRERLVAGLADPQYRHICEISAEQAVGVDGWFGRAAQGDAGGPQIGNAGDGIEHHRRRAATARQVHARRIDARVANGSLHRRGQRLHPQIGTGIGGVHRGRDHLPAEVLRPGLPLRRVRAVHQHDGGRFAGAAGVACAAATRARAD